MREHSGVALEMRKAPKSPVALKYSMMRLEDLRQEWARSCLAKGFVRGLGEMERSPVPPIWSGMERTSHLQVVRLHQREVVQYQREHAGKSLTDGHAIFTL